MSSVEELKQDCAELKSLLQNALRPNVRQVLASEISRLESKISIAIEEKPKAASSVKAPSSEQKKNLYTTKLTSYGWDQTSKFVKIYVTLKDVESLSKDRIQVDFTKRSFNLLVSDLHGKNYSLVILGLLEDIVPEESFFKAKSGTIIISLKKGSTNNWEHLTGTEKKAKDIKTPKVDQNEDPSASIMSMMKQMYQDGDDEMKRTIAKAWTESREKRDRPDGLDF